jgi:hypothetical protein
LTKDLKTERDIEHRFSAEDFVERLSHHVPDRYANNVRYFGLLAPRTKARLYDFIFHLLGQQRRRKPRRLSWAAALNKYFGVDPLIDSRGQRMHWVGRINT